MNEYSAKLTDLVKAICRSLNLTEDLRIISVFAPFYEHEVKRYTKPIAEVKTIVDERIERGFVIGGWYDPRKKA